eukprot:jgi/Astpho2/286/Aster-02175
MLRHGLKLMQVKESMAEGEPGHTSKARSVSTGARWFQSKRVPLYFMVGAGFAGASLYLLTNRSQHPSVEAGKGRQDSLHEERDGAHAEGKNHFESSGRKMSRDAGLMSGQHTDGIIPNTKIAKKLGEILPTMDSEPRMPKP